MENEHIFKYQVELDNLREMGIMMPPLKSPVNKSALRYVFVSEHKNNHKPIYIHSPQRMVGKNLSTSGFALSCFETYEGAIGKYRMLLKNHKNICKSIGNALCSGVLNENDGLISEATGFTHFDLYEFQRCDLSSKFAIIEELA